jgi:ribosome-associated toxin RatA of RatAB toxin-antitoxin module
MLSDGHERGRKGARVRVVLAAAVLMIAPASVSAAAGKDDAAVPDVSVHQERGVYVVNARFEVPQSPAAVLAVLTDYGDIPRFMPDVTRSIVRERSEGGAVVEQEAVSRVSVFSKRVHLVLEVTEEGGLVRFRDRCGRSFTQYEGSWRVAEVRTGTEITYQLNARPSFDIPDFLLTRVLKRNATRMIEQLRGEIAARAEETAVQR